MINIYFILFHLQAYEHQMTETDMAGLADHMTHSRQVQQRHYNTSKKRANAVRAFKNIQAVTGTGHREDVASTSEDSVSKLSQ